MESLLQSARRRDEGEALPTVFPSWAERGIHYYRGSVHVTAAAPGVGKSTIALSHAIGVGVPTLYICADTPRHITAVRAGQMLTSNYKAVVEAQLEENDSQIWDEYKRADHIGAFYRSGITADEIVLMIGAFAEIRGEFPHLVILDNLTNVAYEGDNESAAQKRIMAELDTVAKEANICFHILLHVSGNYKNGTTPIPQDGVMGKLAEYQHTTMTWTRGSVETELLASCVKNRTGPADPSGLSQFAMRVNFETMQVTDAPPGTVATRPAESLRAVEATHPGTCQDCDFDITPGDLIVFTVGGRSHADCV